MIRLNFHGARDDTMGYGRMFIGLAEALEAAGVELYEDHHGPMCEARVWCCHPCHVREWLVGQRPMVFAMYETDFLPSGLHENIHEFDTVFVPSFHCVSIFSEHHGRVIRVPLGIDPRRWPFQERLQLGRFFNVYMPGQGQRKGIDVAFRVFQAAFPKSVQMDPEPHLIHKTLIDEGYSDERMEKRVGMISADEERTFYDAAHVSLNLSRGEGWGLMPLQAISSGIPTILTDAHGHADFAHLGLGVPATKVPSGPFIYGESGNWWEPDFDSAVDWLREVYHHYDAYKELARRSATLCHEQFRWSDSARIIMDEVGESDFIDSTEVHTATPRLFWLRVNRYIDPTIAGERYEFYGGEDYQVPADVRRVLQVAGYVDEVCLADTHGKVA